jgi:hypothetical protein
MLPLKESFFMDELNVAYYRKKESKPILFAG